MATKAPAGQYATDLNDVPSCDDRVVAIVSLPGACCTGGMTSSLYANGVRIFDHPRFAEPLRDWVRERAREICAAAGIEIECVSESRIRKEELVARVLARRGHVLGLVHGTVLSALPEILSE